MFCDHPPAALVEDQFHQPHRAPQRRDQAPHQRCRGLSQRGRHPASRRRRPDGATQRMGCKGPALHADGDYRATGPYSSRQPRLTPSAGRPRQPRSARLTERQLHHLRGRDLRQRCKRSRNSRSYNGPPYPGHRLFQVGPIVVNVMQGRGRWHKAVCRFCDTDFVGTDGQGGGRFAVACRLADRSRAHCSRKARDIESTIGLAMYCAKVRSAVWTMTSAGMPGVGAKPLTRISSSGLSTTRTT